MYLNNRVALPINSNPGYVLPDRQFSSVEEMINFSAWFICGIYDYKSMIDKYAFLFHQLNVHNPQPLSSSITKPNSTSLFFFLAVELCLKTQLLGNWAVSRYAWNNIGVFSRLTDILLFLLIVKIQELILTWVSTNISL